MQNCFVFFHILPKQTVSNFYITTYIASSLWGMLRLAILKTALIIKGSWLVCKFQIDWKIIWGKYKYNKKCMRICMDFIKKKSNNKRKINFMEKQFACCTQNLAILQKSFLVQNFFLKKKQNKIFLPII